MYEIHNIRPDGGLHDVREREGGGGATVGGHVRLQGVDRDKRSSCGGHWKRREMGKGGEGGARVFAG